MVERLNVVCHRYVGGRFECRFARTRAAATRRAPSLSLSLCHAMPAPNCEAAPYQRYRFDKETITIVSAVNVNVNRLLAFELKICVLLPSLCEGCAPLPFPVRRCCELPFPRARVL